MPSRLEFNKSEDLLAMCDGSQSHKSSAGINQRCLIHIGIRNRHCEKRDSELFRPSLKRKFHYKSFWFGVGAQNLPGKVAVNQRQLFLFVFAVLLSPVLDGFE
jgi:hypothetical protein